MPDFVHLNCHTDFSLLEGAVTVNKLVAGAKDKGMTALALTDTNNLFGSASFYKEAHKVGLQPILGISLLVTYGKNPRPVTLLAADNKGWQNLQLISSEAFLTAEGGLPSVTPEYLEAHAEGIIFLSGGTKSELNHRLLQGQGTEAEALARRLQKAFPGRCYLEMMDHGIVEERKALPLLAALGSRLQVPLVATNGVLYLEPGHAEYQDTLVCIGTGRKKNDLGRSRLGFGEYHLRSAEEMIELFRAWPEAVSNTQIIAQRCRVTLPFPGPMLPEFEVPNSYGVEEQEQTREALARVSATLEGMSDEAVAKTHKLFGKKTIEEVALRVRDQYRSRLNLPVTAYFVHTANNGLRKRYPEITPDIQKRLDYELGIIILMDFVGYFLIVADFINWAKDNDIPMGPGRGSGAGSLVAYSLRITDLDPLHYSLLFERFLNPERISMPDFDVDICFERRGEVIAYVTNKYGAENVGQIITFGTLKPKAVVKDVGRVLGISFNESNYITSFVTDKMPDPADPKEYVKLGKMIQLVPELKNLYDQGGIYKELFDTATFLEGMNRHASTHASGIVIGRSKLTDFVPLYTDPITGSISTQYTMDLLEDCGLVKMDLLGLKTLTLTRNTLRLLEGRGIRLSEEEIPTEDNATFQMLCEGKSAMVFQFESFGMRKVLKQAKPHSIEDLTALNALYRPGPMDNIPQFVECKGGKKTIEYPHPSLEPILKETYGVIVYQEQVMQAAQILAGYTLGGADLLRRAMAKKKHEEMVKQRTVFCAGALKQHRIPETRANEIFGILEKFASYGFNKSHAAAYAVVAYKTAYLKANFPAEFLAANLTNEISAPKKLTEYLAEAHEMGLAILPPHVNHSDKHFTVREGKIVFGLLASKNLGEAPVDSILQARAEKGTFSSLHNFLDRVNLHVVTAKAVENLILSGSLDGLGPNRATMAHHLPKLMERAQAVAQERSLGQVGLFGEPGADIPPINLEEIPEFNREEKLGTEKKLLGFFFSGHPMDDYRPEWEAYTSLDLKKVRKSDDKKEFQVFGRLKNIRTFHTKKGETMASGTLEDFNGHIEVRVYPKVLERIRESFVEAATVGLKGKVDFYEEEAQFVVNDLNLPETMQEKTTQGICVKIRPNRYKASDIMEIHDFLRTLPGTAPLVLHLNSWDTSEKEMRLSAPFGVSADPKTLESIQSQSWCESVWRANVAPPQ